ncbi:MAG: PHA/PHB synthase family protein, partial [Flavobacteriaceae bacterium]
WIARKGTEKWVRFAQMMSRCAAGSPADAACITPLPHDHRFDDAAWSAFPYNAIHQAFLLNQQWWHNLTTGVPGVSARNERLVEFYSRQFLDMLSPSNFPATNPEVLQATLRDGGLNFLRGFGYWLEDMRRQATGARPVGADAFVPGRTVAVTPGEVVYENRLIELIQYRPASGKVHEQPLLIVPAWIMKYYILDLSPDNSLIAHLVSQGFSVFCISWKNPGEAERDLGLDDYRRLGVEAALDAVQAITGARHVHTAGYCLGGTLLTFAAAALATRGDRRIASMTLLAAQVDFTEAGELSLFVSESQLALLEDMMWRKGYLDKRRMAGTFQMLRSQDLVWSRSVREYLMGERAPVNDMAAWSADTTRMPYRMHSEYLRRLYLGNDLAEGRMQVDGRIVYPGDIAVPVFAVATTSDHIAPWRSVFKAVHLLDGDITFVLTNGGHNAGIVSPPGRKGRAYQMLEYRDGDPHPDPDLWRRTAVSIDGSWWPDWVRWLQARAGDMTEPPAMGGNAYRPLRPAPGAYVLED